MTIELPFFVTEFYGWVGRNKDQLSVIITAIGIPVLLWQITQGARQERQRLRREKIVAKATLPLTLNALSAFGVDMMDALGPLERWLEGGQKDSPPAFSGPQISSETVLAAEKVIAAYPRHDVARCLAALLGEVQVLQARTRDLSSKPESVRIWSIAMKDNIVMAASVVARCQDLFDFARGGQDFGTPYRLQIEMALRAASLYKHLYPRVWEASEAFPDLPKPSWRTMRMLAKIPGIFGRRLDREANTSP